MMIEQYEVYWVDLDPTKGTEIKKTRPCVVISPNEMNQYLGTVIVAPVTSKSHPYPMRVEAMIGKKSGWVVLDQIRAIDKSRLTRKIGKLSEVEIVSVKQIIKEMLVD